MHTLPVANFIAEITKPERLHTVERAGPVRN
jgi:hypothetical protein